MNVMIFGIQKSRDTKKALRFFKERGIKPQFVDLSIGKVEPCLERVSWYRGVN